MRVGGSSSWYQRCAAETRPVEEGAASLMGRWRRPARPSSLRLAQGKVAAVEAQAMEIAERKAARELQRAASRKAAREATDQSEQEQGGTNDFCHADNSLPFAAKVMLLNFQVLETAPIDRRLTPQ